MNMKIVRYKDRIYVDIIDVAIYFNELASTEDTDTANRIREAVKNILSLGDE